MSPRVHFTAPWSCPVCGNSGTTSSWTEDPIDHLCSRACEAIDREAAQVREALALHWYRVKMYAPPHGPARYWTVRAKNPDAAFECAKVKATEFDGHPADDCVLLKMITDVDPKAFPPRN